VKNAPRYLAVIICLLLGCGSGSSSDDASTTGDTASGSGGSSGTGGGSSGTGGSAGGTGGASGGGSCQACVACVQASCAAAVTQCQASAACTAIYDCARMCQMSVEACILANQAGVFTWGPSVANCINQNCLSQCTY
jgi:hypothetical protein